MTNKTCALYATLRCEDAEFSAFARANRLGPEAVHTHHIWGGTQRLDLPSNLIRLSLAVHDWVHQKPTEGKIACMWWMLRKGPFSWNELSVCAGKDVNGWLECQRVKGVYESMRKELLK